MTSHLAIVHDDGIPLWLLEPTAKNLLLNTRIGWMEPHVPCIVIVEYTNGTCLIVYDGIIAYAVTECLFELY